MAQGWKPPKNYTDHIWDAHYTQCQHGMAVLGKKWCDYIVYCNYQIFKQRIVFDPKYWENHYSTIKKNYEIYIRPYLKNGYPIVPC